MLSHKDQKQEREQPGIRDLLEQVSADGRAWAEAELALARVEAGEFKRQAVKIVVCGIVGFAAALSTLVALSQAGILLLAGYVGNTALAALITAAVLLLLAAIFLVAMRNAFAWRTESIFFRWFGSSPSRGTGS